MNKEQRERKRRYREQWRHYGEGVNYPMWLEQKLESSERHAERVSATGRELHIILREKRARIDLFGQCMSDLDAAFSEVDKNSQFVDTQDPLISQLWKAVCFVKQIFLSGKNRYERGAIDDRFDCT